MSDDLSRLRTSLADRYTIERELGGGGMSRVYVAREHALGREVVVKVLTPELADGVSAERFAREVATAARLQQANIVPVLATGEADGVPYYTMPYVRGESLRARLAPGSVILLEESLSILRDVARALAYAHAEGIVHRDIKPENILLSGGTAVVTDFGIAKALSASRAPGGTGSDRGTLTRVGSSVGTPVHVARAGGGRCRGSSRRHLCVGHRRVRIAGGRPSVWRQEERAATRCGPHCRSTAAACGAQSGHPDRRRGSRDAVSREEPRRAPGERGCPGGRARGERPSPGTGASHRATAHVARRADCHAARAWHLFGRAVRVAERARRTCRTRAHRRRDSVRQPRRRL